MLNLKLRGCQSIYELPDIRPRMPIAGIRNHRAFVSQQREEDGAKMQKSQFRICVVFCLVSLLTLERCKADGPVSVELL